MKYLRQLISAALLVASVLFIIPAPALADHCDAHTYLKTGCTSDLGNWLRSQFTAIATVGADVVTFPIILIASIINFFLGIFVGIAGYLLEWAISPAIPYITAPSGWVGTWPIHYGWTIVRDLANMGFVLAIVVIAIATILRFEQYGMRQLLWKLIIAAVLVNFSLVIMGVIVDATNLVMHFFISEVSGVESAERGALLSWRLLTTARATQLVNPNLGIGDVGQVLVAAAGAFTEELVKNIASALFGVLFMLVLLIVMGALAFMMLVRHVIIWVLAIVSPIIFVLWVFPGTRRYWNQWWNEFLKWTLFGPAALFFVFISVNIVDSFGKADNMGRFATVQGSESFGALIGTFASMTFSWVLLFITFMILLIMSLVMANQFGIAGAKGAMDIATKVARYPERVVRRAAQKQYEKRGAPVFRGTGKRLEKIPGLGWAGRDIRRYGETLAMREIRERGKDVKEAYDLLKYFDIDELTNKFEAAGPAEKVAIAQILSEKGKAAPVKTDTERDELIQLFNRFGAQKELLYATQPHWALFGQPANKWRGELEKHLKRDPKEIRKIDMSKFLEAFTGTPQRNDFMNAFAGDPTTRDGGALGTLGGKQFESFIRTIPIQARVTWLREFMLRLGTNETERQNNIQAVNPELRSYLDAPAFRKIFGPVGSVNIWNP